MRRCAAEGQDRRTRRLSWDHGSCPGEAAPGRREVVGASEAQACDVPVGYQRRRGQLDLAAEQPPETYDGAPQDVADPSAFERLRRDLEEVGSQLRAVMQGAPSSEEARGQSVASLDSCLDALKQVEGATAAMKARLVSYVSAARTHRNTGHADTGAYLRDRMRLSGREAKKQAELSRAIDAMDGVAEGLAQGTLGVEQATVLGQALRRGRLGGSDEVQAQLLEAAASSSPEELRREVKRREQAVDGDALLRDENLAHSRRTASLVKQDDGMWQLHARLDPIAGEHLHVALRSFRTRDDKGTPPERRRTPQQRTADALTELARAGLVAGAPMAGRVRPHVSAVFMLGQAADHVGGDGASPCTCGGGPTAEDAEGGGSGAGGDGASSASGRCGIGADGCTRTQAYLPGVGSSLPGDGPGVGILDSGTLISPEAMERLLCDAGVTPILMGRPWQPLAVGRARRDWTIAQRRAVIARDGGCRGPGCDRPADWCDVHHIDWWTNGGETSVANGLLICRRHHRLIHEGRWTVELDHDTGRAIFTDPRGKEIATLPRGAPTLMA